MFRQTLMLGSILVAAVLAGGCSFHFHSGSGSQPAYSNAQNGYSTPARASRPASTQPAPTRSASKAPSGGTANPEP